MSESRVRLRRGAALLAVLLGAVVVPLGLRAVNRAVRPPDAAPSYIPSIESPRVRAPFDSDAVAALREAANDYILIGDSMAGTRIDPGHLSRLIGGHGAAALFHPGSGPAYWYLTFKNLVINAGLRPRVVVFFFRDENLTDTLFRVYPSALDRVAQESGTCARRDPRGACARDLLSAAWRGPARLPVRPDARVARAHHHPRAGRLVRRSARPQDTARLDQQRSLHARGAAPDGGRRHGRVERRSPRLQSEPSHVGAARDPAPVEGVRHPRRLRAGPAAAGRGWSAAAVTRAPGVRAATVALPGVERSHLPRRLGRPGPAALGLRGRRSREEGLPENLHGASSSGRTRRSSGDLPQP